jgi:hypothetical protein
MASTGHILLGNHAVNHTKMRAPTSALGHGPDLHLGNPGPAAYGGHTPGTTLGAYILECTRERGLVPSLITGHSRDFHPGSQTAMTHGGLAQGTVRGGHIFLGNREIVRTNRATPVASIHPV